MLQLFSASAPAEAWTNARYQQDSQLPEGKDAFRSNNINGRRRGIKEEGHKGGAEEQRGRHYVLCINASESGRRRGIKEEKKNKEEDIMSSVSMPVRVVGGGA